MSITAPTTSTANRRDSERTMTTLRGKAFPGALDCVVNDFSRRGARLIFPAQLPLDDHLVLVIWTTGLAFETETRWRETSEVGVEFQRRFDLRGTVPSRLLSVKAQWLNRRRRLPRRTLLDCRAMTGFRAPRAVRLS